MKDYDYAYWNKLVLRKLKYILLSGALKIEDDVRYIYRWDDTKSKKENLKLVRCEDRALLYLIQIGVIEADHITNEYRKQELEGNLIDKSFGVHSDWNEVDPAYREYEYETEIYGIYFDKFEKEIDKYNLVDNSVELIDKVDSNLQEHKLSKPIFTVPNTKFSVHDAWRISYDNQEIVMQPQIRKIAAYIMENSIQNRITTPQMITDHNMANTEYNASDNICRARTAFKNATKQNKNFFPNERNIGYRFTG